MRVQTAQVVPALLLAGLAALWAGSGSAPVGADEPRSAEAIAVAPGTTGIAGSETCAPCHEDVVSAFGHTAHGIAPGWSGRNACETCHGPGQAHADGDLEAIRVLEDLPPREAAVVCLDCHSREARQFRARHAVHSLADVSCIDCHDVHSTAEHGLPARGVELCSGCHRAIAAQFDLPRAHPLVRAATGEGGAGCEACHDPHTSRSLRVSEGFDDGCADCHSEKAGPFVYPHEVGLVNDCSSCHQVHGAPTRHLLTHERQINLCYQCHPGTRTPGFHNAINFLDEKCTACHTAIHGSYTHPAFLEE